MLKHGGPPAGGGHPGGRRTGGHPGGRRTGGRYTTDGHACSRYGRRRTLRRKRCLGNWGIYNSRWGREREKETKRKVRGRGRDNERGAREIGATKRGRD